jgi:hypothetical protein
MKLDKSTVIIGSLIILTLLGYLSIRSCYHMTDGNDIFKEIEKIEIYRPGEDSAYCQKWNDSIFNKKETIERFEKLMLNSNDYDGINKKVFPIYERIVMKVSTKEKDVKLNITFSGADQPVYIDVMWPEVYVDQRISFGMAKFLDSLCIN